MDPSQGMIAAAQSALENDIGPLLGDGNSQDAVEHVEKCQVQYIQGAAEDLSSVQPGSVDLITAGIYALSMISFLSLSELTIILHARPFQPR